MNQKLNPLGQIVDYKYRIEFQHRGSPHVHMLVWVKDAPTFEKNTKEELKTFIDSKLTCSIPPEDDELHDIITLVQQHTHSVACRKHGTSCRFNFPRPPLNSSQIFKPLDTVPSKVQQHIYSCIITAVYEQLDKSSEFESLDKILETVNTTEEQYIEALHWIKTKNGQPAVLLKRDISEINVNYYNTTLMSAWEANLDVQFVTNVYSCVMYLASYISKPEKTLGDVLKAVSTSSHHLGPKTSMRNVAHKFLTNREVSAHEAVYRLLALPLTQGSRQVLFIYTDFPENRTRLFRPMKLLQLLEDDDPDVYQLEILDRYPQRPNSLQNMCLREFAAKYKTSTRKPASNEARETDNSDSEQEAAATDQKHITLENELGYMVARTVPAIVRYQQWSLKNQSEQYYHARLLLYYPWVDELKDILEKCNTYKEKVMNQSKMFCSRTVRLLSILQMK